MKTMIVQDASKKLAQTLEQNYQEQITLLLGNVQVQTEKKRAIAIENAQQEASALINATSTQIQLEKTERLEGANMHAKSILDNAKNELVRRIQDAIRLQIYAFDESKRVKVVQKLLALAKKKAKEQGMLSKSVIRTYKGLHEKGVKNELENLEVEIESTEQIIHVSVQSILNELEDRIVNLSLQEIEKRCGA